MRPVRHATMQDDAEDAHVSHSTVSRILSSAPVAVAVAIAPSTRERVLETGQRLRYRPNPLARGLRGAPTMLIGAIVRDVTDPFFAVAIDALSLHARRHGYAVVLGHVRESACEALTLAAVLEARQCDAIVLLDNISDQLALLADLVRLDGPVVELWQGSGVQGFPAVAVDNRGGMRAVLQHLAELGHRHVAFVGDPAKADMVERRAAFEQCGGVVLDVRNTPADAAAALDALLDREDPPTAVAAATDVLASGILHRAAARGLRVPADLSVTGFDDIPLAASAVPALTTVRMPVGPMAEATVRRAVAAPDVESDGRLQTFSPELVVRASTGRPAVHR